MLIQSNYIPMKKTTVLSRLLMFGFILTLAFSSQAQWVTLARKVKSMRTGGTDVATVIIEAGATKVYRAVIDTLTTDPKFGVISRDDGKKYIEFSKEPYLLAIRVDSLANNLAQIIVASNVTGPPPKKPTDMAVDAIFRVCNKVGVKCTLE
jgi:hypothetical protein